MRPARPRSRRASAAGPAPARRNATPRPPNLPFEPTGWKTVLLDHFSCQCADYAKEAAFYAALMNWKIRNDDGKQALLDIGDWGGLALRGGYQAPAAAPTPPAAEPAPLRRWRSQARARRARRGARRTTGSAGASIPGMRRRLKRSSKKRGLNPVADNQGKDFQSFHVEGPGRLRRADQQRQPEEPPPGARERQDVGAGAVRVARLEDGVARSHFTLKCRTTRKPPRSITRCSAGTLGTDEGSQNSMQIGDIGGIIIRRGNRPAPAAGAPPARAPRVDRPQLVRHHAVRSAIPMTSRRSSTSAG